MAELSGLAAVVTGGGSGIGLATARLLASRDAKVAVLDLKPGDEFTGLYADVTDDASVREAISSHRRARVRPSSSRWFGRSVTPASTSSVAHRRTATEPSIISAWRIVPTAWRVTAPAPLAMTSGKSPKMKAKLVIITGRKRSAAPSIAAV